MRANTKRAVLIALCVLCGVALVGGGLSAFFGLSYFASFECAFIGFSLILSASFFGIIKQAQRAKEEALLAELNAQKQESVQDSIKQKIQNIDARVSEAEVKRDSLPLNDTSNGIKTQIPFTSRFLVGVKLSFSFLRLLCYIGFIFMLIGLLESKLFEPVSFLIGSIASVVVIIASALQSLYKN